MLLAFAFYLGFAPACFYFGHLLNPYAEHHLRQALALFTMLFGIILIFFLAVLALSYTMIFYRPLFEAYHLESLMMTWGRRIFLCWLVFWAFATVLALLKSERVMPIVGRIMTMTWVLHITSAIMFTLFVSALGAMFVVAQSHRHATPTAEEPKVVVLYDDVNRYPSWIFYLGFYRIAQAGHERWGDGAVAIEKINHERLEHAIAHARFIFLATHGQAQGILMDGKYVKPSDISAPKAGRQLQYVYLTGCDSGSQRQAWEEVFAPAQVVTFDRLTALVEHVWWMWVDGPEIVRGLEEPHPTLAPEKKVKKHKRNHKKELNKEPHLWQNAAPV